MRMRPFVSLLAAAGLAVQATAQAIGDPAPDIQWQKAIGFGGAPAQKLSDLRGSVVLLEFWATWCGPCRASIPRLQALHAQKADLGLVIVGVTNEAEGAVEAFRQRTEMPYPIALAKHDGYDVRGIPHALLIDVDGKIVWKGHPAQFDQKVLDTALVGARPAFVTKGMEDVHALWRNGDAGGAYNKAGDLLRSGSLAEGARNQATAWMQSIVRTVATNLAAADEAVQAQDVFRQWSLLEPIALRYHGVPGADAAAKRFSALLSEPQNRIEIDAGKKLADGKRREEAQDFDGAWSLYKDLAASHAATKAGKEADQRRLAIENDGKLGFAAACDECKAAGTACAQHRRRP